MFVNRGRGNFKTIMDQEVVWSHKVYDTYKKNVCNQWEEERRRERAKPIFYINFDKKHCREVVKLDIWG